MTKPWTASRVSSCARSRFCRPRIGDPIRPFALGLWNDIRPLLKPDVGITKLRRATGAYLHSKRYFFATAQPDSMRFDVQGNPAEPVSDADRLAAQERYLNLTRGSAATAENAAVHPLLSPEASRFERLCSRDATGQLGLLSDDLVGQSGPLVCRA